MALETFNGWIPVEYSPDVIQRPDNLSAIESVVPAQPMNSNAKQFPRSGASEVAATAKGAAINEDAGTNDWVTVTAVKFANAYRIANEDLDDSIAPIIATKQTEYAISYSKVFDNACLGTSAAANGGTVPFTSLYEALTTADASTGYVANANHLATAAGGVVTYDLLSQVVELAEVSDFYVPGGLVVVAHPSLKGVLRGIKTTQGLPILNNSDFGGNGGTPETLFGMPIKWSLGAALNATASAAPTGNKFLAVINPAYLINGTRSATEATVDTSAAVLSDDTLLVMRTRKGFAVTQPSAHALLEVTP